jgi:hypothetical protein
VKKRRWLFRSASSIPKIFEAEGLNPIEGLPRKPDQLSIEEIETIERVLESKLRGDELFIDLNYPSWEDEKLVKRHSDFQRIKDKHGYLSPSLIVIENYIDFFMVRYPPGHDENYVRRGLFAEKAFDILLQGMGMYVNYPEPIRDWRKKPDVNFYQPIDFYVPILGSIEVKSARNWKSECNVNIPIRELNLKFNYIVALKPVNKNTTQVEGTRYIEILGAMRFEKVRNYKTREHGRYYRPHGPKGPFLSIPANHFYMESDSITPDKLYKTLQRIKDDIDKLPKISL